MIAVSISIPSQGKVINAAIADHVPVAELIPHLVEPEPGQLWELQRAVGVIAPENTLAEAGVRAGEAMTLEYRRPAEPPAPPLEASDELSGDVGENWAAWIVAACVTLLAFRASPMWHPLDYHGPEHWGFSDVGIDLAQLLPLVFTGIAALAVAALGMLDRRFIPIAAALGFAFGLNVNVLCGFILAALLVWRPHPARVSMIVGAGLAAVNFSPAITSLVALLVLIFSGQIALAVAKVIVPRVPAAGIFRDPVPTTAGPVIEVHSAVIVAACAWLIAGAFQLISPSSASFGHVFDWPIVALIVCLAVTTLSARGTRPFHAHCLAITAGVLIVWLGFHVPWGIAGLALVAIPLIRFSSPQLARIVDAIETVAFCAAVPLALHVAGVFELVRGLG